MDASIVELKVFGDERGALISLESGHNVTFDIKRCYYIYGTRVGVRRGFHAHKTLNQLLICLSGQCKIFLDDGATTMDVLLDHPTKALHLSGLTWREMYDFSEDCVLMVLADQYYSEDDYIRNYQDFLKLVNSKRNK